MSETTVNDIIDGAIISGFKRVNESYISSLEDDLRKDVAIQESGDAQTLLQNMINYSENNVSGMDIAENLGDIEDKLSRLNLM